MNHEKIVNELFFFFLKIILFISYIIFCQHLLDYYLPSERLILKFWSTEYKLFFRNDLWVIRYVVKRFDLNYK